MRSFANIEQHKILLEKHGWSEDNFDKLDTLKEKIHSLSLHFGTPKPSRKYEKIVQEIKPKSSSGARQNTLSKIYSDLSFPLHVDTAHWIVPSRFCFMVCLNSGSGNRKTTLLDYHKLEISESENELLRRAIFRVINGRNSFFSTILSPDRNFIRYDPGCMFPVDDEGRMAIEILNSDRCKNSIIEFEWTSGKVLILDNWRMLHGRSTAIINDSDRILYRVLTI